MLRSLSSAVSGLRNHQTKMDVIGNNIANVNTTAYKSGQVRFEDLFSQTIQAATAPQVRGGMNPIQVGLGMNISSINNIHVQGAISETGRPTDLAIEGVGFFVVSDGRQTFFTRDGIFSRDANGELVNANGYKLQGWMGEEVDPSAYLSNLYIPLGEDMVANATGNLYFAGNLDTQTKEDEGFSYETYVYDSLGNRHTLTVTFTKMTEDNTWKYEFEHLGGIDVDDGSGILHFTENGRLRLPEEDGSNTEISEFTIETDTGSEDIEITPFFNQLTQLSYASSVAVREQDGFPPGELASFDISRTGVIVGTYTNGMVRNLGQVAMASFPNPEGLVKEGSNLYQISANSGDVRIGLPGVDGRGMMQSSSLEMSNVDLAYEFTEMITTSRAYQANTRVISTSDEMLVELVNLKR